MRDVRRREGWRYRECMVDVWSWGEGMMEGGWDACDMERVMDGGVDSGIVYVEKRRADRCDR